MVGNGYAMGVAGQIVENMFGAAEGWLGVDDPVLLAEFRKEVAESATQAKLLQRAMELEHVVFEQFAKPRSELAAETAAKCLDRQEETARGIYPPGTVESQAACGNDVVDVGMMLEVLSPGMEHAEESDVGSQVLGLASQFEHRRSTGSVEQMVKQPLVLEGKRGKFMRQREDDVEIRHGQQFCRARRQPFCARVPLALGAVPVAA